MSTAVCVFGLGLMGRPMARRLLAAGYQVCGWNRSLLPEELTAGIPICPDLAEAAQAKICLLSLADSVAVDAVVAQLEPYLSPGHVVMDMGTSNPAHSRSHAWHLATKGVGWVDAPVSGGPEGVAAGSLAIMVGSTMAEFIRVRPFLEVLGRNVVRVGGPGAGHTAKVINQLIVGLTIEAVAEALTLAEKSGLDPQLLQQALQGGFADSKILQIHGSRMINRAYMPGGKVATQLKDLRLGQELAQAASIHLPHLESVTARYQELVAQGDSELDHSALHKLLWS